ncbi:MAG: hypothetical protein WAQ27_06535 [Candidatus Microsaccharimonas sp.]
MELNFDLKRFRRKTGVRLVIWAAVAVVYAATLSFFNGQDFGFWTAMAVSVGIGAAYWIVASILDSYIVRKRLAYDDDQLLRRLHKNLYRKVIDYMCDPLTGKTFTRGTRGFMIPESLGGEFWEISVQTPISFALTFTDEVGLKNSMEIDKDGFRPLTDTPSPFFGPAFSALAHNLRLEQIKAKLAPSAF